MFGNSLGKFTFRRWWNKIAEDKGPVEPFSRMDLTQNQKAELHLTWKRLKRAKRRAPVESDLFHRFMNRNIKSMGTWSERSLQQLHNAVDKGQGCVLCRKPGKQDRYSHTYFECSTTTKLLKDSGMIRGIQSLKVITASLWIQWFMDPKLQYQIMSFFRAIHDINHDYRFNTSYSTPNEEYPIMQAYVTECHEKRKQGFFQFHRNYHRAVP
jgi:hypothetical protein